MANEFDSIIKIITDNWWLLAIGIIVYIIIYVFKHQSPKKELKPVKRSEIERENFLRRMQFNDTAFKKLIVNGIPKYKIKKLQASTYKDGKEEIKVFELVLVPLKLRLIPFGRENGYNIRAEHLTVSDNEKDLELKRGITLWYRNGVYMDNSFTKDMIQYFNRDYSAQTDLENLSSIYYASAQEQSVINPERGHETLESHLNIELEKEKRRKMQMGV